jgi:hypothetical protein
MSFLEPQQSDLIFAMSFLHGATYNDKPGKLWLLGENECTITKVSLRTSRIGNYFIAVELNRKPCTVYGLKSKVYFVPHVEYLFNEEQVIQFLKACNYELKPKPAEMSVNEYLRHVKRRVDTFIGKQIKVVVCLYKEVRKDEYGDTVMRNKYFDEQVIVEDMRMKLIYELDWRIIFNTFYS